jgi:DNA-binding FadR family transcriptional regulator
LGLVPQQGELPSERTLASQYGVSRTTAREALLRLRARGLVEVHPGRRARAVPMEQVVRLENLGTALLGESPSHPERQHLLAGYLELKREVAVELLSACCEKASEEELEKVQSSLCQVSPGGAPLAPAPRVPGSTASTGVLWPRSTQEEDSLPWSALEREPGPS